jgi:hypothetical protein
MPSAKIFYRRDLLRGQFEAMLRLYVTRAISALHACQAGVSEKKKSIAAHATQRVNAHSRWTATRRSDDTNLRDELQTAQGGGVCQGFFFGPGSAEVKRARLVISTRGRSRNLLGGFS